jgi:putative transposase
LPVDRSTYHYRSCRAGQPELTARIKEIAAIRVRYGYRASLSCCVVKVGM